MEKVLLNSSPTIAVPGETKGLRDGQRGVAGAGISPTDGKLAAIGKGTFRIGFGMALLCHDARCSTQSNEAFI